jgi:DNA-binding beta-propeller fold protein YncE
VDLGTDTKTILFPGLSSPHQLALDLDHNWIYVVERGSGELSRIELVGYTKSSITGALDHPVGLAITSDGNYAYVTEGGTENRVSQVDLSTGVRTDVVTGLDDPFYLTWNDESQTALYLIERGAVNRLSRIDLTVSPATTSVVADGLSFPSGVLVDPAQIILYITTDTTVTKVDTYSSFFDPSGPWLQGVGHIPSSEINSQGYANTPPDYSFGHFVDSPFGKVLKVWGNFDRLLNEAGAEYYKVKISKGSA